MISASERALYNHRQPSCCIMLQFEHWVAAPSIVCSLFFGNPNNLPRLMPPWMEVKLDQIQIVSASIQASTDLRDPVLAGAGSLLSASYRTVPFLPFRIVSEAKITAFAPNQYSRTSNRRVRSRAGITATNFKKKRGGTLREHSFET